MYLVVIKMVSKSVIKSLGVIRFILERGFKDEVSKTVLKGAISIEIGSHPVTINSYIDLLETLGVIHKWSPGIFKIDLDRINQVVTLIKNESKETRDSQKVEQLVKEVMLQRDKNVQ